VSQLHIYKHGKFPRSFPQISVPGNYRLKSGIYGYADQVFYNENISNEIIFFISKFRYLTVVIFDFHFYIICYLQNINRISCMIKVFDNTFYFFEPITFAGDSRRGSVMTYHDFHDACLAIYILKKKSFLV